MGRSFSLLAALFVTTLLGGCMPAPVGATGLASVPEDGASQCASQCTKMGLRLSAVAVMANHVGCVCQVPMMLAPAPAAATPAPAAIDAGSASVAPAGMATIALLAAAQAEQQAQQQQQQQQQHRR